MVTPETIAKVKLAIAEYAEFGTLKKACENNNISLTALFDARQEVPIISQAYAIARQMKADTIADDILDISDTETNPHRARVRIDARKWICAMFNRSVYGEKIDLSVNGTIDLTSALDLARNRIVRPIRDPEQIEESQTIDITPQPSLNPTDNKSDDDDDPFS